MKEWIIRRALGLVAGITSGQWDSALELVQMASRHLKDKTGAERKAYVINSLKAAWESVKWKAWVLDVLVGMAYGFAKGKGWIK